MSIDTSKKRQAQINLYEIELNTWRYTLENKPQEAEQRIQEAMQRIANWNHYEQTEAESLMRAGRTCPQDYAANRRP